ncbi:hypothetical protein LRC484719_14010 [Mycobacterium riyadhense]
MGGSPNPNLLHELDPTMAQQYDAVWRWIDWPDRRGKTDTGIDLVARERETGNHTAILCKFYEPALDLGVPAPAGPSISSPVMTAQPRCGSGSPELSYPAAMMKSCPRPPRPTPLQCVLTSALRCCSRSWRS